MNNVTFVSQPTAYDPGADQVTIATPTCCSCCCCCVASSTLAIAYAKACNSFESRDAETAARGPVSENQRMLRILPVVAGIWLIAGALEVVIPGLIGIWAGLSNYEQSFDEGAGTFGPWATFVVAFIAIYPFVVWFSLRQGRSMGQLRVRRLLRRAAKADAGEAG